MSGTAGTEMIYGLNTSTCPLNSLVRTWYLIYPQSNCTGSKLDEMKVVTFGSLSDTSSGASYTQISTISSTESIQVSSFPAPNPAKN